MSQEIDRESWKWGDSHMRRMSDLLKTGFGSDLDLVLGSEKTKVPVHKIFLQSGSPVLNFCIKQCTGTKISMRIPGVDTRIFGLLLKYLYTGESGASMGDALALLQLATDYEVDELRDQCATLLKSDLTQENVLPLFQGAMEYAHKELIQSTLNYICRQGRHILKRNDFANLRLECLIEIIQQDNLRVKDEMAIYEAVYRWGEAECVRKRVDGSNTSELRKVLDKPLKYVRFPLMDKEEFALKVGNKNILDMSELTTLLTCFLVSPERRNVLPSGRFSSTPRTYANVWTPRVYSRLAVGVPRQTSDLDISHLTETIMIRSEDDGVILSGLSIWSSLFQLQGVCHTYYFDNRITANLTIKCDQETLFEINNQVLVEKDEFMEFIFAKSFTFPRNKEWVELNLRISGYVGYDDFDFGEGTVTLTCLSAVTNYGNFFDESTSLVVEDFGVAIKRKDGDTMPMTEGIIEKLTFETL